MVRASRKIYTAVHSGRKAICTPAAIQQKHTSKLLREPRFTADRKGLIIMGMIED